MIAPLAQQHLLPACLHACLPAAFEARDGSCCWQVGDLMVLYSRPRSYVHLITSRLPKRLTQVHHGSVSTVGCAAPQHKSVKCVHLMNGFAAATTNVSGSMCRRATTG